MTPLFYSLESLRIQIIFLGVWELLVITNSQGVGKLGGSVGVEGIRAILLSKFACMNREWGVK
jgi:hypothetical protein